MKLGDPFRCGICGKDRSTDANHWWLFHGDAFACVVRPWAFSLARRKAWEKLCGMNCLQVRFGQWAIERVRAYAAKSVQAAAEQARQNVKPIVDMERKAEERNVEKV